jgi:hypothetical protein
MTVKNSLHNMSLWLWNTLLFFSFLWILFLVFLIELSTLPCGLLWNITFHFSCAPGLLVFFIFIGMKVWNNRLGQMQRTYRQRHCFDNSISISWGTSEVNQAPRPALSINTLWHLILLVLQRLTYNTLADLV